MNKRYERQTKIIADARKAMGYSQQQVATIIGVHVRQYQRIECGERDIRYASMKLGLSICAVLGKMKKILKTRPDGRCWNDKSMAISHYRRSDYQRNLR